MANIETKEWFGLTSKPNSNFYLSTISLFPHTLSEKEFATSRLLFHEKNDIEKAQAQSSFQDFFETYISHSNEIGWAHGEFFKCSVGFQMKHFLDFLRYEKTRTYINTLDKVIFDLDHYLEVMVYSLNEFQLANIEGLFQRTTNVLVSWEDTPWCNH